MEIKDIINQVEGRSEFKEGNPGKSELAKTAIAFANDAGGTIFIGIKDNPRSIVGVDENNIMHLEEQVSNIIFDQCHPLILAEISILNIENKIIAGVFKKLGIMEQWGNGLKIISEDLKNYPEIEFKWSEPGIAFRVTFLKKNYEEDITLKTTLKTTRNITDLLGKYVVITRGELLNLLQNKLGESWEIIRLKLFCC